MESFIIPTVQTITCVIYVTY